jgi:hypothetical protein
MDHGGQLASTASQASVAQTISPAQNDDAHMQAWFGVAAQRVLLETLLLLLLLLQAVMPGVLYQLQA